MGNRQARLCRALMRGYAEIKSRPALQKEMYEVDSYRRAAYRLVGGRRSLSVPATASVSSRCSGVPDPTGTVGPCRTRMDGRPAPSIPSHAAGHSAHSLRLVRGVGATMLVAPGM